MIWLLYSEIQGQHVIFVVGISDFIALILDPATTGDIFEIDKNALLAVWTEMDLAYVVVSLSK